MQSPSTSPDKTFIFEKMPVPAALAKMAIPTIVSQMITLIYNIADTWFIGQTNNPYMVAASSLVLTIFLMTTALANIFGVGGGTLAVRMLGSSLIAFAIRLTTGRWLGDPTSGMRMYNRRMIRQFATQLNIEPEPDTIAYLIQSGAKVAEVQVEMKERMAGQSYLSPIRSACYMVQMGISIILFQKFRRKMALD